MKITSASEGLMWSSKHLVCIALDHRAMEGAHRFATGVNNIHTMYK